MTRKIIITGTHLTPALEFIHQLKQDKNIKWDIYYIGRQFNSAVTKDASIESNVIPKNNVKFYGISSGKFDRRWLPNTLRGLPSIIKGFFDSLALIDKIQPQIVLSFGGYVSVPVIIAAFFKRIPSLTHEQTSTLSLSTKINSLFCRQVALSFPMKNLSPKYIVTGNLLREDIFKTSSSFFEKKSFSLEKYPLIYITAGNQGSHHLNTIIEKLIPVLTKKHTLVHQTGSKDLKHFKEKYKNVPQYFAIDYINSSDIGWIFHNSQLVITRSGANTAGEIVALSLNSIQIPLPFSQQNEQEKNARWVKKNLPANTIIIDDSSLNSDLLLKSINSLSKTKKQSPKKYSPNLKLLNLVKRL